MIILSIRTDAQTWWRSAEATVLDRLRDPADRPDSWAMCVALWEQTLHADLDDMAAQTAAYERWNEQVRRTAPADRLLEWQAADGWEPLCTALGKPVPDEPFPSTNSTLEWRERRRQRLLERRTES